MKPKTSAYVPIVIAASAILFICLLRLLQPEWIERVEAMTYDWRVRFATYFPSPIATNLGFVAIEDSSIAAVNNKLLGNQFGLYWPRHVFGRVVRELSAQGAVAISFDVLFGEPRTDHADTPVEINASPDILEFLAEVNPDVRPTTIDGLALVGSDEFLAWQMRRAGNVLLAAERKILPTPLLRTNAHAIGDISADRDGDGILRRARAFKLYPMRWHPCFEAAATQFGVDLQRAEIWTDRIVLPNPDTGGEDFVVPLGEDGCFALKDFVGEKLPPGMKAREKPFAEERVWHMGIVLAAQQLGLDLANAQVELEQGRITLRGPNGLERVIPVDEKGYFYIDWVMRPNDPRLAVQPIEALLKQDLLRRNGRTNDLVNHWSGMLAIVGSAATGNDLTDWGSTPLDKETILVSKHWNVANAILTGRFIHRTSTISDLGLIILLGIVAAFFTWWPRPIVATFAVSGAALAYVAVAWWMYVGQRIWLPIVLPVFGALLFVHLALTTYRVVFEQRDKRRVKSIFSRVVSEDIMDELLKAETLALGGARREVTVYFADVRGFTEMTDIAQEQADALVRERKLAGAAADAVHDEYAREMLNTVNTYLALVADTVKANHGTHDKYIGDCVMSFWGAPLFNPSHALECVRAAIEVQRAIRKLNTKRSEENQRREKENAGRVSAGLTPLPRLPVLSLGSGINTGMATVGIMGSEAHQINYTVFGREVNLASRLEGASGRGRIVIGERTYQHLLRDDPGLAARCVALPHEKIKGFRETVQVYEVHWRLPNEPLDTSSPAETTSREMLTTTFIRRD